MTEVAAAFSAAWNSAGEASGMALFAGPDGGAGLSVAAALALPLGTTVPLAAAAAPALLAGVSVWAEATAESDTIATPVMRNFANALVMMFTPNVEQIGRAHV